MKGKYEACNYASFFTTVTNEESTKLLHDKRKYPMKGTNGYLEVESCAEAIDSTISEDAFENIGVLANQNTKIEKMDAKLKLNFAMIKQ